MKALVLTGTKQFEMQDVTTPTVKDNEVLVNTAYAGICGTDRALYAGLLVLRMLCHQLSWVMKIPELLPQLVVT